MTTLNEHELHAMAGKLRNAIGPADLQPAFSTALDDMLEEALKFAEMEPAGSC